MSFVAGTAAGHVDLFTRLIAFLTADPTLVALKQNWAVAWRAPRAGAENRTDILLRGPGLAQKDEIYVGLRLTEDLTASAWTVWLCGATAAAPTARSYKTHVNSSQAVGMPLDKGAMAYRFVASGRRFIVVVKISTVYTALYAGLFLPYAPPASYPYPLFIGGSHGRRNDFAWRARDQGYTHFPWSYENGGHGRDGRAPSALWLDPMAQWRKVNHYGPATTEGSVAPWSFGPGSPFPYSVRNHSWSHWHGYRDIIGRMRAGFNGDGPLTRATLIGNQPSLQHYGALDGVFHVPGFGNSAENVFVQNGVAHLAVQNVYRTGHTDYWALRLA